MRTTQSGTALKKYSRTWPPNITIGDPGREADIPPRADPRDVVLAAEDQSSGELRLRLRNTRSAEYTLLLPVPARAQRVILADIRRWILHRVEQHQALTLSELGELRLRPAPS